MNRQKLFIGFGVLIVLVSILLALQFQTTITEVEKPDEINSQETAQITPVYKQPLNGEARLGTENSITTKTFTDRENKIQFVFDRMIPGGAQNDPYDIVLNGKILESLLAAKASSQEKFSADGRYFVYRERGVCGAGCYFYTLVLVDIENETVNTVPFNHTENENIIEVPGGYRIGKMIESFEFFDQKIHYVTFLHTADEFNPEGYRASPKEVWEYDFATGENRLNRTLED